VLLESQIISPANSVSGILTTRTAKVIPTPKFAANVESILSINRIKLADIFSARNMYIAEPKGDLLKALNNLYVNEGTEIKIK
jgi:hypothetical protein